MTISHKDIPEDGLHEPKGASTAVSGTVPVSDGGGATVWEPPQLEGQAVAVDGSSPVADGAGGIAWVQTGGGLFGEMSFNSNTTAHNILVASPTPGDGNAVLLTGANLTAPGVLYTQTVADTIPFENTGNNELLRVPQDGVYEVRFNCSFTGAGGGNIFRFNTALNGVEQTDRSWAERQTSSSDVGNVAFSDFYELTAGTTVQPTVANLSGTNNPVIRVSSFTIILLKST